MRPSFDIPRDRIPSLITWFNSFVGFSNLQNLIGRVEQRLATGTFSNVLLRRYQFHTTYRYLHARKRLSLLPDIHDFPVVDTLSFIASVEAAQREMSLEERDRFRARILDGLKPDRDLRQFQHELRAYVHYKRANCRIEWVDNNTDRFDFLVHGPNGTFELECKTFAENIGNAISVEDSFFWFEHIRKALKQRGYPSSGTFDIEISAGTRITQNALVALAEDALSSTLPQKQYEGVLVQYRARPEFDQLLGLDRREQLLAEFDAWQSTANHHCMLATNKQSALFFSVHSDRAPRPYNAICDSLKRAAKQFSTTRPAVIWGHFLGLSESEMRDLLERDQRGRTVLDVFGAYLFKTESRNHVCRLRLSADGDLLEGSTQAIVRGGGPAYELNSSVSKFHHGLTEEH